MDRREEVLLHQPLADDDGVLVVVALPGHEGHQDVAPQGQLPLVGAGTVGQDLALLDLLTAAHDGHLVDRRALVAALELHQLVDIALAAAGLDYDLLGGHRLDDAVPLADDDRTAVHRGPVLHAGADQGRFRGQQRHRLTLHVRAHQGAVGIVVLQEGDQGRGHRDDLHRRHVHEVDLFRPHQFDLRAVPRRHPRADQAPVFIESGVGLGDDVLVLFVGSEEADPPRHHPVLHLAVGGLDEPQVVHAGIRGQRGDQPDVRALRRLDRAHPAVVRGVHITHLEAGALPGETPGAQCGEAALVRQFRQRVGLVHELRELATPEELLDRRHHRPDVDQDLGRDLGGVLDRHALADHPFHPQHADAELVLQQLADGAHPAVAQVVDVVVHRVRLAAHQPAEVANDLDEVLLGQRAHVQGVVQAELLVQLVPPHPAQIVAPRLEEEGVHQGARRLHRRRVSRTQPAVDLDQRLVLVPTVVLVQGGLDDRVVPVELLNLLVALVADRPQQHRRRDLSGTVDAGVEDLVIVRFQFQPGAAVRDDRGGRQRPAGGIGGEAEVDPRGADELADHHPLGAINNEGPPLGHEREVPHEDLLLLDLAGLPDDQTDLHLERGAVVVVPVAALLLGVLQALEPVAAEVQHGVAVEEAAAGILPPPGLYGEVQLQVAGEVLDRRDLVKDLADALAQEPLVGAALHLHEVGEVGDLGDLGKGEAGPPAALQHAGFQAQLLRRRRWPHRSSLRLRLHVGRPRLHGIVDRLDHACGDGPRIKARRETAGNSERHAVRRASFSPPSLECAVVFPHLTPGLAVKSILAPGLGLVKRSRNPGDGGPAGTAGVT